MNDEYDAPVAMIIDIVGSRKLDDRERAQAEILAGFARGLSHAEATAPPIETVGDEFQGVFPTWAHALTFTAVVRLALSTEVDVRFGLGLGNRHRVTRSGLEDGSAWWAAREAIDEARRRQTGRQPSCRTWYAERLDPSDSVRGNGAAGPAGAAVINAYLLDRDATISRMKARERRWCLGLLEGRTQEELGSDDGVSQPAVSKALAYAGATSLVEGLRLMKAVSR